jgi:hypothetical protein
MKIEIGFDLPFAVRLDAVPPPAPLRVVIETLNAATEENFRQLEAHVQLWVGCAMYGAGGGPSVAPTAYAGSLDVAKVLGVHDAIPAPNAITFEAPGVVVEAAYANILLHKLLCLATLFVPLKRVAVTLPTHVRQPSQIDVVRAEASQFPDLAPLSFAYTDDTDTGADSVTLTLEFAAPPTPAQREELTRQLWSWLGQGAQGGYISPPWTVDRFALITSGDPVIRRDELSWPIDDVDCDPRAFNCLANLLQAFSARSLKILEVRLE